MKKLSKALTTIVVMMMLLQTVGMSGMIALASVVSPDPAPTDSASPATSADKTAPVTDPAPAKVQAPAVDTTMPTAADAIQDPAPVKATPAPTSQPSVAAPSKDAKSSSANTTDITTSSASDWNIDGDTAKTKENVKLGVKYEFPGNKDVSVTFTQLPKDESKLSTLKIEQIASDKINLPDGVSPATDFAYDITTDMQKGDFQYDLTLPKAKTSGAEVKFIEKSAKDVVSTETTGN